MASSLTIGQGIGLGVVVGFVASLLLIFIGIHAAGSRRFSPKAIVSKLKSPTSVFKMKLSTMLPKSKSSAPVPEPSPEVSDRNINKPSSAADLREPSSVADLREPGRRRIPISIHAGCLRKLPIFLRLQPIYGTNGVDDALKFHSTLQSNIGEFLCYESIDVSASIFDEDQLVRLAGEPVNGGTWSESISNLDTRIAAVKCFLAQLLFRRIHPSCDVEDSLLPPEVIATYKFLSDHAMIFGESLKSLRAVWREISYILLQPKFNLSRNPIRFAGNVRLEFDAMADPRALRLHSMVPPVLEALRADKMIVESAENEYYRPGFFEDALKGLFEEGANVAMVLFAQPSEWEYSFTSKEPGFIYFPEVRLMWDEGELLSSTPAKVVTEHVRVRSGSE